MGSGAFRHFAEVRFSRFWSNVSGSFKSSIFPGPGKSSIDAERPQSALYIIYINDF